MAPTSQRKKKIAKYVGLAVFLSLLLCLLLIQLLLKPPPNSEPEVPTPKPRPRLVNLNLGQYKTAELINLAKSHLIPPAPSASPYSSVSDAFAEGENEYHEKILELLKMHLKTENPFFVEAGPLNDQSPSHTLGLEMNHGWSGLLLVEASSPIDDEGEERSKQRKCWSTDVCLTGKPYMKVNLTETEGELQCFSLFTLLTALKVKMVDLLVLDFEGLEFEVLRNHPFNEIPIKMIAVEHVLLTTTSEELEQLMRGEGYELMYENGREDYIFLLRKYVRSLNHHPVSLF